MTALVILLGIALAAVNIIIATLLAKGGVDATLVAEIAQQQPAYMAALTIGPILLAILAFVTGRAAPAVPASATPEPALPAPPPKPTPAAALRLLALLQQEARFVDFIHEDIDSYSDEQVGAAVRSIHAGCRKTLAERITLERVMPQEDGASVTVDKGFDPTMIRLTGKVSGEPPFRGTLEHGGWRATKVNLPLPTSESDATIIAPAEVEIA